ncbi:hypothetical protein HW115_07500 [Verrucomicrobiaceae bacterium N1E253]|uniref:Pectate lyase superfamily protein domain-containing protein n=1 Tax=Oceaniferula marina TaxID=2748318 RepID=A0A851GHV8_9BACT|nr:hypothetical protein [Oceaniferula marina]NWK55451.1 hypothetical protein [Oceaniferula marina]
MQPHFRIFIPAAFTFLLSGTLQAEETRKSAKPQTGKPVRYSDFGAKGDGKTDDMEAIAKAHAYANQHGLKVIADPGRSYYIGGTNNTAVIQTDTDFNTASFIIDDTALKNHRASIFTVSSKHRPIPLKGMASLNKGQTKIDVSLPSNCLVEVTNSHKKHYIRYGANQNKGASQTDIFLVDRHGKVDARTPILWDFKTITQAKALPIDLKPLQITGGTFTTLANRAESKYSYHNRGISIRRSNVIVSSIKHIIQGEGEHGAPYHGFINLSNCADVKVKNSQFSGHKTYRTIGSAGRPVSMGSYDLSISKAVNISFIHCRQINDIHDRSRWGIMASNYCKNLIYDHCELSRFDAHKGVHNAMILNSIIGHAGINAIGHGKLILENTTVVGRQNLVNLRSDYGSTWDGEFIIRNCKLIPAGSVRSISLITGHYSGQHDFGYTCHMPRKISIDGLRIEDAKHHKSYPGPALFSNINPRYTSADYIEKFPYIKTKEVTLKNVTTASGKPVRVSDNRFMFNQVKVKR